MNAKTRFDAGDLPGAIQELNQTLRSRPTDTQARVFLFEILCFAGDYDRAGRQLDVLRTQASDPGAQLALEAYRDLLAAERMREQVFDGTSLPKFLTTPPPSVEQYAVLLAKLAKGHADVAERFAEAEEAMPVRAGDIDGAAFSAIRDADDRLAPVLEAFHGADYLWLPFEQITSLELRAPTKLRDLLWTSAVVELEGHPSGDVFIPALYVRSHRHPDNQVKLGRMTEWEAIGEQIVTGAGQRVLMIDGEERALLTIRNLRFTASPRAHEPV
jgi:type VI secretion system protein ImpE